MEAVADSYGYPIHYVLYKMTIPQITKMLDIRAERNKESTSEARTPTHKTEDDENIPSVDTLKSWLR